MNITRVKIQDWRSIELWERQLKPGLNVLLGENERGKSTIVEAIHKALYWDHTGRKTKDDKLDHILPNTKPTARPTVELDLQLGNVEVTVTKVVTDKREHRQCVVKVRRPGEAEQTLEGDAAEKKLAELLSGQREGSTLYHSSQARGYEYLGAGLPTLAIHALTVNRDGAIVSSRRLERVRKLVETERNAKLKKKLQTPLADCALANTEAASRRDALTQKLQALQVARDGLQDVEQLRREILRLDREIANHAPQLQTARELLARRQEEFQAQEKADRVRLERQTIAIEARQALAELEKRAREIDDLRRQIAELQRNRTDDEGQLEQLERKKGNARLRHQRAKATHAEIKSRLDELRRRIDAVTIGQDFVRRQETCEHARKSLERIEGVHDIFAQAQKAYDALGSWPKGEQIGQWRKLHRELAQLVHDAGTKLQLTLKLVKPFRIEWLSDGKPQQPLDLTAGEPRELNAVRSIRLTIDEVGEIQVACGAEELNALIESIQYKTAALDEELAGFGVTTRELPAGFDLLEERRQRGEQAQSALEDARRQIRDLEKELGKPTTLREQAAKALQELTAVQTKLDALRAEAIAPSSLEAAHLAEVHQQLSSLIAERVRESQQNDHELETAAEEFKNHEVEFAKLEAALSLQRSELSRHEIKLKELSVGMTDDDRSEKLNAARLQVADAERALAAANDALMVLGPRISGQELTNLQNNLQQQSSLVQQKENKLRDGRTELRIRCEDDPQGTVDRLEEEYGMLKSQLAQEERKLAALVLLDTVLNLQRQKLAELLSQPLNERIASWLQQIRGKPTSVRIDAEKNQITTIVSGSDGNRVELPFEEHSEGFKGQFSLLVRLILAQAIAQRNGSGHFVILDDPLVETSPGRRPDLFRILHHAAQDVQILFVTCHEDVLLTLPSQPHRLEI